MTNPAINPDHHDVVLTGTLSNIRPHADGGVTATLTHPEVQVQLRIPTGGFNEGAHLIGNNSEVTVGGTWAGESIRVEALSAGAR